MTPIYCCNFFLGFVSLIGLLDTPVLDRITTPMTPRCGVLSAISMLYTSTTVLSICM